MARIEDIPEPTRSAILALEIRQAESRPFVTGPALSRRRVAMVSSAALIRRGEAAEFRALPATLAAGDILMSHVSINYDRAGWQSDINTIYPIDRLRELVADGTIGAVADTHYSVMGSTDPATMTRKCRPRQ